MKHSIRFVLGGAILLALPMFLTSCEDILGHWEKPAPAVVTPEPGPEPAKNYRVYISGTAYSDEPIPAGANVVGSSDADVTWDAETYVVDGNVSINGNVTFTRDVKLIIKDGAKLTVNGSMLGYDGVSIYYGLSIYGQKENSGKLIINATNAGEYCLHAKSLEVHGCEINAESKELFGIYTYNTILDHNITIYSGKLTAKAGTSSAGDGQIGIGAFGNINVYGGNIIGIGADGNGNTDDKVGIYAHGNITVKGGNVEATGGNGGSGLYSAGDITIDGNASVTATADGNNGIGIRANNIQIGQTGTPTVNATGKNYGIRAVTQIDFIAGNVKGTSTGVMTQGGISSGQINYYGGSVEGEGGEGGVGIWGGALGTITNKSGATVTIGRRQYPTEGWTAEDVADNAASTKYNRYMILPMPVAAP